MTRQDAISTGKAVGCAIARGTRFLVIGRWGDTGEYWCEAGTRTEAAANEKRAQVETMMGNHPRPATFEVVAI